MSSALGRARTRVLGTLLGVDLRGEIDAIRNDLTLLTEWEAEAREHRRVVDRHYEIQVAIARRQMDDIAGLRSRLQALRQTDAYAAALAEREPLVTVRIPTYERTEQLMEDAIPSVLRQTYERIELVIVNDGPNDRTRRAVEGLRDPRIVYEETSERGDYPDDRRLRWLVAGTPNVNRATQLAAGTWIAPLDDDDTFTDDHIEKLLNVAWDAGAELAYGALHQRNLITGAEQIIWSDPPQISAFSFQGSIYLTQLRFFEYEILAWVLDEPGDWNLIRRMKEAGVRMASTSDIVGHVAMVPYNEK